MLPGADAFGLTSRCVRRTHLFEKTILSVRGNPTASARLKPPLQVRKCQSNHISPGLRRLLHHCPVQKSDGPVKLCRRSPCLSRPEQHLHQRQVEQGQARRLCQQRPLFCCPCLLLSSVQVSAAHRSVGITAQQTSASRDFIEVSRDRSCSFSFQN